MFGCNFAPRTWGDCDGQLLPISQNSALFSLLGTMYGGDGRTTFGLPELRGRMAMHVGHGPGLPNYPNQGQKGGVYNVTLTQSELPSHNHAVQIKAADQAPDAAAPTNAYLGHSESYVGGSPTLVNMGANMATVSNTGGSQAFSVQNPFQVVRFCIALQGVFPSRS